jgi:cell division protein FtsA
MQIDTPNLFVEINNTNYIFIVGKYNENQKLEIVEKLITPSDGIYKNKFTNIHEVSEIIKKNVEVIEKKLNFIFKDLILIIDNFDYSCVNISGFKKLNGSQVLKENISYILNSLKLAITENEKEKTILHIFNSKSVLDGTTIENLPIGLFGDFYNHELTFFLIRNNDLKNIKQIFNKINLNVKKIFLKSFSEGVQLINQEKNTETFFKIKLSKNESHISFFDNAAFRYSEHFNFGTDIIFKDIEKICSIDNEIIKNFLLDKFSKNKDFDDNELLEEKYFTKQNYRKIRKKLIVDIASARIDEIASIIFNSNTNIRTLKQEDVKIYLIIKDKLIFDNFKNCFKSYFSNDNKYESHLIDDFDMNELIVNTANLSTHGWKKEAIPVTQTKNSLITRIFKTLFG